MKSLWIEADRTARSAVEAELRRRGVLSEETLREALRAIGPDASVKALACMVKDRAGSELAAFVRQALPA